MQRYILVVLLTVLPGLAQTVAVQVDPATRHQTMLGWGATAARVEVSDRCRLAALDDAVNDLGLTRLRFEIPRREWEDAVNDDGDPYHITPTAFDSGEADLLAERWVVPFRQRVEARGERFTMYVSPSFFDGGSSGSAPIWMLQSPAEYTEWAIAFVRHLRDKYKLVPDYYSICNEAGNGNGFSPGVLAAIARELGPALAREGLPTKLEYPECMSPADTWRYLQPVADDPELWKQVGMVAYHLYGDRAARTAIRDLAQAKGLPTAQTEFMGTSINDLYDDLTDGGCSAWEHYVLCANQWGGHVHSGCYLGANAMGTSLARYEQYANFRAVMHYVRPGAVRIGANSPEPSLGVLAFDQRGAVTVVLLNTRPGNGDRQVSLSGLPAGRYGLSAARAGAPYRELGLRTVTAGAPLALNLARGEVYTLYPYAGGNLAPSVADATASPAWVTPAVGHVTLSASGCDPELATLSWQWSVVAQPAGADAVLATPTAAKTEVSGLTRPGEYGFRATVSDATSSGQREVWVRVVEGNLPPTVLDLHNRLPVTVTVGRGQTELRGGGLDPEGDPLTYAWSLVSQPAGASANLATPDKQQCKLLALTVPGVYRCRLTVSDGAHSVSGDHDVVVHANQSPPVIRSAGAAPAVLAAPGARCTLSVDSTDPQGSPVTHWWVVKSAPAGAKPVIVRPGSATTEVTGLDQPGTYLFTVTAINQQQQAARGVTVVVGAPAGTGGQPAAGGEPVAGNTQPATNGAQPSDPPQPTSRDDRVIIARGYTLGVVSAVGPTWIEIKSDTGAVARYIPDWHGGMPAQGGGPDRAVVAQIQAVAVGQRVRAEWHVNDHIRLENVGLAP